MSTITDRFRAGIRPDAVAFLQPDAGEIGYGMFAGWVAAVAAALAGLRPEPGGRVTVVMPRSPAGLALFLGTIVKDVCCPAAPGQRREELERFFETSQTEIVAASAGDPALALAAERGLATLAVVAGPGSLRLAASAGTHGRRPAPPAGPDRTALLLQTSGTTSAPKMVLLRHSQVLATATGIVDAFSLGPDDLCLNPMPFSHGHGLITAGLSSMLAGSRAICLPGFSAAAFAETFERFRPTWFTGSPAMHIALLDHYKSLGRRPGNDGLRFFRSSSAPLPSTIIGELEDLFEAPLIETYGLTETATMIVTNPLPPGLRKVGSVGLPCSGAEVKVATAQGGPAAPDEEGELLVRGPSVIMHYGESAAHDPANFTDGWLRTGDVGRIDADGYVSICGRTKELIKRGGLSVYPNEVDAALLECPGVVDAGTFSLPHRTLGEEVVAAVVMAAGARFDEASLRHELMACLSSYKVPSAIVAVPAIRKGETGKIARREIARAFADALNPQNLAPADDDERELLARWRAALGRDDLGVTDNLFLFGADPMVADRVRLQLPPGTDRGFAFKHPTVREQATHLRAP